MEVAAWAACRAPVGVRPGVAATLACVVVEFEITPQPSDEERTAIAAALAEDAEVQPSPWPGGVLPAADEPFEP